MAHVNGPDVMDPIWRAINNEDAPEDEGENFERHDDDEDRESEISELCRHPTHKRDKELCRELQEMLDEDE